MESVIFLGSIILWGGVFAWHSRYCSRPVFTLRFELKAWVWASLAGVVVAAALCLWLDPSLRRSTPEDYPANLVQWLAMTLFHLAFIQLFLVFAPFAWSIRLCHDRRIATALTVAFGVMVLLLKVRSSPMPLPLSLFAGLVVLRVLLGLLSVSFYLRGGVVLVWWCGFLIEARHLLNLSSDALPSPL